MFFTFPENARWDAVGQAVEFGSRLANTKGWSGCRDASSNAYYRRARPPNVVLRPITYSGHGSRR